MKAPKVIELSLKDREDLIERINHALSPEDAQIIKGMIDFNNWLQFSLQEKSVSIGRLRRAFGSSSEKRNKKKDKNALDKEKDKADNQSALKEDTVSEEPSKPDMEDNNTDITPEPSTEAEINVRKYVPNNGRLGHEAYTGAEVIKLKAFYKGGDPCPEDFCDGKLYPVDPGVVIKIVGQSFAKAIHYELETLRCNVCSKYISAELPEHVCRDKYDPVFKAELCVHKYFLGVPSYRLESYQKFIGVPLPDSTQFDKIEDVANAAFCAFRHMEQIAANGHLVHGDDTNVKIQSLIKENKGLDGNARTGMFTTGIISFYQEHQIHLFYSGRKHCGENIAALLEKRDPQLPPVQYMCDALGCNMPKGLKATLINCLIHGRRNFTDIDKFFPEECGTVIEIIAKIYKHDAQAHEQGFNAEERLEHHQKHSADPMESLHTWLQEKLDKRAVEGNSSLGKAFKYMLKHWQRLTQFLRIPGAPLDNNILERALKIPIRVRKNSLFYATEHGAYVGSMLQSIICTCIAASANPVDYLTALQIYKREVHLKPSLWMPWNYKATMAAKAQAPLVQAA